MLARWRNARNTLYWGTPSGEFILTLWIYFRNRSYPIITLYTTLCYATWYAYNWPIQAKCMYLSGTLSKPSVQLSCYHSPSLHFFALVSFQGHSLRQRASLVLMLDHPPEYTKLWSYSLCRILVCQAGGFPYWLVFSMSNWVCVDSWLWGSVKWSPGDCYSVLRRYTSGSIRITIQD